MSMSKKQTKTKQKRNKLMKCFSAVHRNGTTWRAVRNIFQHLDYITLQVNLTSGSLFAIHCTNGISNPSVIAALLHLKFLLKGFSLFFRAFKLITSSVSLWFRLNALMSGCKGGKNVRIW